MARLRKKKMYALLGVLVIGMVPAIAKAKDDVTDVPWKVLAEKMTRSVDRQEVIAEGDVEIIRTGTPDKPVTIYADWVRYDVEKGIVYARGDVRIRSNGERVEAEKTTIVLADETVTMFNSKVYLEQRNLYFQAEEGRKNGEMSYWFKNAVFTTCDFDENNPPVWSLEARDIDIDVDGFIWLKHSFLNIKDVPVLYLPFMGFPGRMDRQTGFLVPEVSNSNRSGVGVVTPFFVNLSPSSDLTLYPGYLSKRGLLAGGEFRHVTDENSKFTLMATYINDRTGDTLDDDYKDDGYLRTEQNRYWIRGKADYDFGDNLLARVDIDTASDRDYLMEFERGVSGFKDSNRALFADYNRSLMDGTLGWRQSTAQVDKSWDAAFVGGKVMLVDDLDRGANDGTMLHSLPNLVSRGNLELWDTSINFNWDADYSNYYAEEGVGSQRLAFAPRFDAPLPIANWLEASVSGGLDQSFWSVDEYGSDTTWDNDSTPSRTSWAGKIDLATTFQRDFRLGEKGFFNHMIRPEVTYTYVEVDGDQSELPDFDEQDRITEESVVGYGFSNHFRTGGIDENGLVSSRYWGYFKVRQGYDFDQDDDPFGDLKFDLDLYPIAGLRIKYTTDLNMYGDGIVNYDLLTRYSNRRGDFVSVDYVYDKFDEVHSVNAAAQLKVSRTLAGRVEFKKSLDESSTVTQKVAVLYQPGCWGMKVEYTDSQDEKRVALMFSLVGAGQSYGFGYGSTTTGNEVFGNMDDLGLKNEN